jgi:hypothetical protein
MTQSTIHLVVGIQGMTLLVFHTEAYCWQFRLLVLEVQCLAFSEWIQPFGKTAFNLLC